MNNGIMDIEGQLIRQASILSINKVTVPESTVAQDTLSNYEITGNEQNLKLLNSLFFRQGGMSNV